MTRNDMTRLLPLRCCQSSSVRAFTGDSVRHARRQQIELFLTNLKAREALTVFRDEDWLSMVDHITINSVTDIVVTFKDGTEIKA